MNGSKRTKEDESSSSDEEVMEMENEEINIEFEGVLTIILLLQCIPISH